MAQQGNKPTPSMTTKKAIDSLVNFFSINEWKKESKINNAGSPIGYYSYNYVFQQSQPVHLFEYPVNQIFAYIEQEKLIALYISVEYEEKLIDYISTDLGAKAIELSDSFGDNVKEFIPFKWYWDYKEFNIGLHKMPSKSVGMSELRKFYGVIIISKYSIEDYTLKN